MGGGRPEPGESGRMEPGAGQQGLLPECPPGRQQPVCQPGGWRNREGQQVCWPWRGAHGDLPHRAAPHAPEVAWTATRRKPFTSPFSLTTATRCTRGTGYSRLLRYTKALGGAEPKVRAFPACAGSSAGGSTARAHDTTLRSRARRKAARAASRQVGRGLCWVGAGWGVVHGLQRRQEEAEGQRRRRACAGRAERKCGVGLAQGKARGAIPAV